MRYFLDTIDDIIHTIFHNESIIMSHTSCSLCILFNNHNRNNNNWPIVKIISSAGTKAQACHKFYKLSYKLNLATKQYSDFFAIAHLLCCAVSEKYTTNVSQYTFQMHYIKGNLNACDVIINLQTGEEYVFPAYRKPSKNDADLCIIAQKISKITLDKIFYQVPETQISNKDWLQFSSNILYMSAQEIKLPLNFVIDEYLIDSHIKNTCKFLNSGNINFLLAHDKYNAKYIYLTRYYDVEKHDLALIASSEDRKQNIILLHQAQYPLI